MVIRFDCRQIQLRTLQDICHVKLLFLFGFLILKINQNGFSFYEVGYSLRHVREASLVRKKCSDEGKEREMGGREGDGRVGREGGPLANQLQLKAPPLL